MPICLTKNWQTTVPTYQPKNATVTDPYHALVESGEISGKTVESRVNPDHLEYNMKSANLGGLANSIKCKDHPYPLWTNATFLVGISHLAKEANQKHQVFFVLLLDFDC